MVTRSLIFSLLLIFPAIPGVAQTLHGHPQKAAYGSPAEYPTVSLQSHWDDGSGDMQHVHLDFTGPIYGEFAPGEAIDVKFAIVLHHFKGRVRLVYPGIVSWAPASDVTWDATGTSTPPVMVGDPTGDRVWTGRYRATVPDIASEWWFFGLAMEVLFENGDGMRLAPRVPFWSTGTTTFRDPLRFHLPKIAVDTYPFNVQHPDVVWGSTTVEYVDYIPIAPISVPWVTRAALYNYGGAGLPASTNEVRLDLDLHNHIPGATLLFNEQVPDFVAAVTFDPAFGIGPHKLAAMKTQAAGAFGEKAASLLVTFVTVDPSAPPVFYVGGTVPQPPPPPPPPLPVETWTTFVPVFQRLNDSVRLCAADGKCVSLGFMQLP